MDFKKSHQCLLMKKTVENLEFIMNLETFKHINSKQNHDQTTFIQYKIFIFRIKFTFKCAEIVKLWNLS